MGKSVPKYVKEFAAQVKKKFGVEEILLFGSRARGDYLEDGDVDLIVVSKSFEKVPFIERASKILPLWKSRYDLEALCYTPEEFEGLKSRKISIIEQAVEEGIAVCAA